MVEVHTPKEGNVDLHRQLQRSVAEAVRRTLACFLPPPAVPGTPPPGAFPSFSCIAFMLLCTKTEASSSNRAWLKCRCLPLKLSKLHARCIRL